MNKEKILPIVTSTIVTMKIVTIGKEIRDQGSNFRYETCKARLLPSFVTITRSIFSLFTLSVNFLKKAEYNGNRRDENVFTVNCRR